MSTKFTSGPWSKDHRNEDLISPNGDSVIIWDCGLTNGQKTVERVANSHLISQAPAMYEMLDEILTHFQHGNSDHFQLNDEKIPRIESLLSKCRGE